MHHKSLNCLRSIQQNSNKILRHTLTKKKPQNNDYLLVNIIPRAEAYKISFHQEHLRKFSRFYSSSSSLSYNLMIIYDKHQCPNLDNVCDEEQKEAFHALIIETIP